MGDTIIIETPVATVLEVSGKQGPQGVPGATGATGAVGPQGPAGTGIETLTTKGDLLSRDDSGAIRVGIGSTGQVLKVSAQGLPSWANESGAVTSVNGQTGAVTVSVPTASSSTPSALGVAAAGTSANFARADHVHAMPNAADVGALDSNFTHETFLYDDLSGTGSMNLPARRNVRWSVNFLVSGGTRTLFLPSTDVLVGDRIHLTVEAPANTTVIVRRPNPGASVILTTLTGGQRLVYAAQVMRIVTGTPLWRTFTELQSVFGSVPAASNSNGIFGSFVFDNSFMYVAIADNTWRRIPIAAF